MSLKSLLLAFVAAISMVSCFSDGNFSKISNQKVLDDSTFNEMVRSYEDEDRIVWQKPEIILEKIGDLSGKTVADIGAGTGYFSFRMLKTAKKVIALDIEPKFLHFIDSIALELPPVVSQKLETRLVESQNTNLQSNEIDAAVMVNTYMYINNREAYMKQLYQNVNAGGKVLIVDFKKKEIPFGPNIEEKVDVSQVVKELENAGFQSVTPDETSLDYQYIVTAVK